MRASGPCSSVSVVVLCFVVFCRAASGDCGDCNGDGAVTVDEVISTVNNALGSRSALPSLPDRCSTSRPGDRIQALGGTYVIVESLVTIEGSSEQYLLRYPERLGASGLLSVNEGERRLKSDCFGFSVPCDKQRVNICGFLAAQDIEVHNSSSYREQLVNGTATPYFSATATITGALTIVVRSDRMPIYLFISGGTSEPAMAVANIAQFGFSFPTGFAAANGYKNAVIPPSWDGEMRKLLESVSIRRR